MRSSEIQRFSEITSALSLTNSSSTTAAFQMGASAGGMVYCISTGNTSEITLNFYLDPDGTGTKYLLCYENNIAVDLKIQPDRATALPDPLFSAGVVYPVIVTGGVTEASVRLGLKT